MKKNNLPSIKHEELKIKLDAVLQEVYEIENPKLIMEYKKFFKKHVKIFSRLFVAAYLLKNFVAQDSRTSYNKNVLKERNNRKNNNNRRSHLSPKKGYEPRKVSERRLEQPSEKMLGQSWDSKASSHSKKTIRSSSQFNTQQIPTGDTQKIWINLNKRDIDSKTLYEFLINKVPNAQVSVKIFDTKSLIIVSKNHLAHMHDSIQELSARGKRAKILS